MFGKKTVASVMSAFNKAITDLEKVEREHEAEAERQRQLAVEAVAEAEAAAREAADAGRVRARLLDIVKGSVNDAAEVEAA